MDLPSCNEIKPIAIAHLQGLQLSPPLTPEGQSYLEYNTSSPESNNSQGTITEPPRRYRTQYSPDQLANLEKEYNRDNYVTRQKRKELADMLGLHESKIKVWFQNRRMKDKRTRVVYPWPYAPLVCNEPFLQSRVHNTMPMPSVLPPYTPFYHPYHHMTPTFAHHQMPLPLPLSTLNSSSHLTHLQHLPQAFQINLDIPYKVESPSHSESSTISPYSESLLVPSTKLVHKVERKMPKLFQPYNLCK
ncbi:PREDICTED: segmentation protein even-skipped-like [Nicrophorus vespilloides]|uniref:Segmentation protein even-skipped-like n=1 Tax=Nicrophorus vespilloides TaxID=110193 RepID=A0ABM1MG86_NICVS|nr:PREDICTED: segmentation protein even-skipped-like [Nicrophorus vespilloides]